MTIPQPPKPLPPKPQPPKPPPPATVMVDGDGRLTKQGYDFLVALTRYLQALDKSEKE